MSEVNGDRASSMGAGSPDNQTDKLYIRKRKIDRDQPSDSASEQSEVLNVTGALSKKPLNSTWSSQSSRRGAAAKANAKADESVAEDDDSTVPKTPSPKSTKAQPSHTPPESPTHAFLDFLDGLPHPSATQAAAAPASDPSSKSVSISPISSTLYPDKIAPGSYFHAELVMHPNAPVRGAPVRPISTTKSHDMGWPNSAYSYTRQRPHSRHNLRPLGQVNNCSGSAMPVTEQQKQNILRQQRMAKLYQESQKHQQAQFAMAHHVMLQKARGNDPNREFFIYRKMTFTLRECLLACALKAFCRPLSDQTGERLSDDTIAEILQHQRDWRDPNGLDCEGLCVALTRNGSRTRDQIQDSISGDRHRWENYAWMSYQSWMSTMRGLCNRMVAESQKTIGNGQNWGIGFGGNLHELQILGPSGHSVASWTEAISNGGHCQGTLPQTTAAATFHVGNKSVIEESIGPSGYSEYQYALSNETGVDLNSPFKDQFSQPGVSQKDECLPKMEVAVQDDVFGFE